MPKMPVEKKRRAHPHGDVPAPSQPMRPRSLSSPMPLVMSFKDLQRLNAMKMEIFGFAGWLASTLFYVLFLMWAYLPDATLRAYGWTYLPSKHWAVAAPAMIVMSYLFSIVLYKAINLKWTPTPDDYATVLDAHSVFLPDDALDAHADAATPPISDIPLAQVNRLLFQ
ncbi:hypothetical protein Poli38472_001367 [Pythium oligandrum]|uniref:PIG-P domain-containing protein n=1 Tax=Pythium oligandrum TaxID=41045 RepID=A0A8K1FNB5_PYTOL|nr:hypothetical protein Poli38472_001367 [Pythium oligandrum]|eukprot:TMW69211.1 hypothetical protein Poli38472_001367 [Pythium oligandrum]